MTAKLILHKYNRCFSFRQLIFLRFCEVSAQNPKPEQKITDAAGKNEKKPCKIEEQFHLFFLARLGGFILSDIITDLERVADHCSNIAVCILQVQEDSFDTHSYLEQVKSQSNEEFHRIVAKEREQYVLP